MNATNGNIYCFSNSVIIIMVFFSSVYSLKRELLPEDEIEAAEMIERHVLDSTLWDIVEPFYHQPISVPYGELDILTQLFPELDVNFPVSEHQLSKYIPWDKKSVVKFFNDWPELFYFKPILDFSMSVPVKSGRIGVLVDRDGVKGDASQRMQFSIEPVTWMTAGGRFSFNENYARWKNRKICFTPRKWFSLKAGNIRPRADRHGLVSGTFTRLKKDVKTVTNNWLYGDYNGWNAFLMNFSLDKLAKTSCIESFLHKREYETIAGVAADIQLTEHVECEIDFIGIDTKEVDDTLIYGVGSTKIKFPLGNVELTLAASLKSQPAIPVRFSLDCSRKIDGFKVEIVYFPKGFFGPKSNLLEDFEVNDSFTEPVTSELLSSEMVWKHNVSEILTVIPSFTVKTSDLLLTYYNPGIHVMIHNKRYSLTAEYQRFEPLHRKSKRNTDNLRVHCLTELYEKSDLQIDFKVRHFFDSKWCLSAVVKPEFRLSHEAQLKPGIKYSKYSNKKYDLSLSIAYTMFLFNAIYSDCSVEKYLSPTKARGALRLNAKMWFAF